MKTIPGALQTMLDSGVTTLCHCWRITRTDGAVFGFTDHDRQLSFGDTSYLPDTGFTPSDVTTSLGLAVDTMEVEGAISSDVITAADIATGLWDDAGAEIYLVDWSDTDNRVITKKGSLGEVTRGELAYGAEIRSLAHRLNQNEGRTYGRLCDAVVGDTRCTIDLTATGNHGAGTVASADSDRIVIVAGLGDFNDGWFAQGLMTWTSGANQGTAVEIRRHAVLRDGTVSLTLWQRAAQPIAAADTFTITVGCAKTFVTCRDKFANGANFRGFPHIPGNDAALGVAKSSETNDGSSFFN